MEPEAVEIEIPESESIPLLSDDLVILRLVQPELEKNLMHRARIVNQVRALADEMNQLDGAIRSNETMLTVVRDRMEERYGLPPVGFVYEFNLEVGVLIKIPENGEVS